MRNLVSNLKSAVPFALKSRVMCENTSSKCHRNYIGRKFQQISIRSKENAAKGISAHTHFSECGFVITVADFDILDAARSQKFLFTLYTIDKSRY